MFYPQTQAAAIVVTIKRTPRHQANSWVWTVASVFCSAYHGIHSKRLNCQPVSSVCLAIPVIDYRKITERVNIATAGNKISHGNMSGLPYTLYSSVSRAGQLPVLMKRGALDCLHSGQQAIAGVKAVWSDTRLSAPVHVVGCVRDKAARGDQYCCKGRAIRQ